MTTARVALLGNPNTGKTTLFNRLCGARAKTANFVPYATEQRLEAMTFNFNTCHVWDAEGDLARRVQAGDELLMTATVKNYGLVGPTGGAATINATSFVGSGVYNAYGNNLTLNGTIANDGAAPTTLKVTGTGTGAVVLPTVGHTFTGGVQVRP